MSVLQSVNKGMANPCLEDFLEVALSWTLEDWEEKCKQKVSARRPFWEERGVMGRHMVLGRVWSVMK